MRVCTIEGCEGEFYARDWCGKHYKRWLKFGDPEHPVKEYLKTPEERWERWTEWQGDCLIWTGHKDTAGYGMISVNGRMMGAHRYAWLRTKGEIPEGKFIDHKECYNPACVNVKHLRESTVQQNNFNRSGGYGKSGHRNVYWNYNGWVVRVTKDGVRHNFGTYTDIEEAARVAEEKRNLLFGEYSGRG